jgi:hypothetical protein
MMVMATSNVPRPDGRRVILWSFISALPCLYLAIRLYMFGLVWAYDFRFMAIRVAFVMLFLGGSFLMARSLWRLKGRSLVYVVIIYLAHGFAFAFLAYAIGRTHHVSGPAEIIEMKVTSPDGSTITYRPDAEGNFMVVQVEPAN